MAIEGSMNIVQCQHLWYTSAVHHSGASSWTNISNFSKSITMKFGGGKVLVHIQFTGLLNCDGKLSFKRDGTVYEGHMLGTERCHNNSDTRSVNHHDAGTHSGYYLDNVNSSAGTTHTYQVCALATGCSGHLYINRDRSGTTHNGRSSITLFEVSP